MRNRKIFVKILSLILCLLTAFFTIPSTAFAEAAEMLYIAPDILNQTKKHRVLQMNVCKTRLFLEIRRIDAAIDQIPERAADARLILLVGHAVPCVLGLKHLLPAVLVECGFLSNVAEEKKLCDENYRKDIASVLFLALDDYLSGEKYEK